MSWARGGAAKLSYASATSRSVPSTSSSASSSSSSSSSSPLPTSSTTTASSTSSSSRGRGGGGGGGGGRAARSKHKPIGDTSAPAAAVAAPASSSAADIAASAIVAAAQPYLPFVVHCRHAPFEVYIGRKNPSVVGGERPEWGNPFKVGRDGDRNECLAQYEQWLLSQPDLVAKAKRQLRGKVLACWCAPLGCHGFVLARIANEADDVPAVPATERLAAAPTTTTTTAAAIAAM